MKEPKVAIIISSYNQKELLENNLNKLKNLKYKNYKIYFIDDSGIGEIEKEVKKIFPFVKTIVNKENLGFSKSYNKGILLAKKEYNPEWFIVLNDDCEITDNNWMNNLLEETKNYKKTGIFGCKLIYPDGSLQWAVKKEKTYFYERKGEIEKNKEFSENSKTKEVIGAFMLVRKDVFEKIGLFDEEFSPFYGEESDFCFRAIKKGYELTYLGKISLIHYRNKSISKISAEKVWFIKKRNSFRLERKHYGFFKRKYSFLIHFLSIFKRDNLPLFKKFRLLFKAYLINLRKSY